MTEIPAAVSEKRFRHSMLKSDLKVIREEYWRERELFVKAEHTASQSFDRAMLTLSSGAFGFSVSFIVLIGGDYVARAALATAWLAFAVSLLLTVASSFVSSRAFRRARVFLAQRHKEAVDQCLEGYEYEAPIQSARKANADERNIWSAVTPWLNVLGIISFSVGMAGLVAFSYSNL